MRRVVNAAVSDNLSVVAAHATAQAVRHELLHRLQYLSLVVVDIDPVSAAGEERRRIREHAHNHLGPHSRRGGDFGSRDLTPVGQM